MFIFLLLIGVALSDYQMTSSSQQNRCDRQHSGSSAVENVTEEATGIPVTKPCLKWGGKFNATPQLFSHSELGAPVFGSQSFLRISIVLKGEKTKLDIHLLLRISIML